VGRTHTFFNTYTLRNATNENSRQKTKCVNTQRAMAEKNTSKTLDYIK